MTRSLYRMQNKDQIFKYLLKIFKWQVFDVLISGKIIQYIKETLETALLIFTSELLKVIDVIILVKSDAKVNEPCIRPLLEKQNKKKVLIHKKNLIDTNKRLQQ